MSGTAARNAIDRRRLTLALGGLACLLLAAPTAATQHLVKAGQDWELLAHRLKPGDEVVLLPGIHRPVTFTALRGTAERPIVIRGADPNDVPTIDADRYGLRLVGAAHVRIADLVIRGATIHGLAIEGAIDDPRAAAPASEAVAADGRGGAGGDRNASTEREADRTVGTSTSPDTDGVKDKIKDEVAATDQDRGKDTTTVTVKDADRDTVADAGAVRPLPAAPPAAFVLPSRGIEIENVTILETGPHGQRHAALLSALQDVEVTACCFEGWAGAGLEVVACRGVVVRECQFIGRESFHQLSGVRLRAGTRDVHIERCVFTDCGDQGVCIGAGSRLDEFVPPPAESAEPGSLAEASAVRVTRCRFEQGQCAVAFVNCRDVRVERSTILRPQLAVVSVRLEQRDPRFGPVRGSSLAENLVTWAPGDIERLTHLGPDAEAAGIQLEENLWWSSDWETAQESYGPFPGVIVFPQLTGVDPLLDAAGRPTIERALVFGVEAR